LVKCLLDEEKNLRLGGDDVRVGVMSFRLHNDRVVVIEAPVRYKRTQMFPGRQQAEGGG
jgi:hypothetical protein